MADHGFLFSPLMVLALLREAQQPGTGKTQTRRLLTPDNTFFNGRHWTKGLKAQQWNWEGAWVDPGPSPAGNPGPYLKLPWLAGDDWLEGTVHRIYPRVQPGDRMWVREAWRVSKALDAVAPRDLDRTTMPEWLASDPDLYDGKIRASMHLPRWASRLTLIVTDVRVQRLHDISEEDAVAEGVEHDTDGWRDYLMPATQCCGFARESYRTLWDAINGENGWAANPWIVAYTFTIHHQNINAMSADLTGEVRHGA